MSDQPQNIVHVDIYGSEYTVRAVANPDYIKEVAAYVDERMHETELNIPGTVSSTRVAILAAMSITDELLMERRKKTGALDQLEDKANAISIMLEDVLDSSFKE